MNFGEEAMSTPEEARVAASQSGMIAMIDGLVMIDG